MEFTREIADRHAAGDQATPKPWVATVDAEQEIRRQLQHAENPSP